jgi:hypothetical protein
MITSVVAVVPAPDRRSLAESGDSSITTPVY